MTAIGLTPARVAELIRQTAPKTKPVVVPQLVEDMRYLALAALTPDQVVQLRTERAARATLRALAKKYGICCSAVCKIVRGESYRHVGGPLTTGRFKR